MTRQSASKATLVEAVELINTGRIGRAESLCRAALERQPGDVNMTAMLGAILLKTRNIRESEKYLRAAIRMAPNFAKPYCDLGILLIDTGRPDEAAKVLQDAVRLDPGDEAGWFNLGKARAMLGDGSGADEAFEKSFELNPERGALAHAAEHQKAGRWEEAEQVYREILRGNPKNVDAMRLLGACAMQAERPTQAERLFRRAIKIAPDFVEARLDLARLLKEQNRLPEAIAELESVTRLEPGNEQGWHLLGSVLAPAARTRDAVNAYRRVVEIRPRHAGAWLGLGHTLKTLGQQEEAIEAYRECIRLRPRKGETWWSLANLKTYRFSDEELEAMREQLATPELAEDEHVQSRVNFLFALAKAHEDRGEFEEAWNYYAEGNRTQRMQEIYDPVRTETLNDTLVEVFDRDLLKKKCEHGHPSNEPIFIVGLPRSGSTLLEQILASHSEVEGTAELPYMSMVTASLSRNRADGVNYPQAVRELRAEHFRQLGQDYLDMAQIHRTEGAPRFIDKMPNNFPSVGFMHLVLPNCKIIDARRYPLDSCFGCFRQLFARGQTFSYDLTDIGEYYLQYERMMDHWHDVLPGRCLTVQYEEVVTDFENQVRRLLEFCELPFEDSCLRFYETDRPVRTASSEQVRQPVHTRSVHWWRNYGHHLGELIEILEPVLPRYAQYESINR